MQAISIWLCMTIGIWSVAARKFPFEIVYEWNQLEFDYAEPSDRQADIDNGTFTPGKIVPIDVDVYYKNSVKKIFITIPRLQQGVPATFGTVDLMNKTNPVITPYPSWNWHRDLTSCKTDRLVSVFRVQIDRCQRLWVLDTGRIADKMVCPPQIVVFDLETDQVVHRYTIPANVTECGSVLVTPIVDIRKTCDQAFVYIADAKACSLIVYDVKNNDSWKVTDKTMYPDPNAGDFNIAGESQQLMDGITAMALGPFRQSERTLYYHALSSNKENRIGTSFLKNKKSYPNPRAHPERYQTIRDERHTQTGAEVIDKNRVMYFGLMHDCSFNCWNMSRLYKPENFGLIAKNAGLLQFASGVKIVNDNQLWVLTSRFQKWLAGTLDSYDVNFRVLTLNTDTLTECGRE